MSKDLGKIFTKIKSRYINKTQIKVCLLKSLPWLVNRNLCLKIIFLSHNFLSHNFLSQYCVQKYLVCISPQNTAVMNYCSSVFFKTLYPGNNVLYWIDLWIITFSDNCLSSFWRKVSFRTSTSKRTFCVHSNLSWRTTSPDR